MLAVTSSNSGVPEFDQKMAEVLFVYKLEVTSGASLLAVTSSDKGFSGVELVAIAGFFGPN